MENDLSKEKEAMRPEKVLCLRHNELSKGQCKLLFQIRSVDA